MTVKDCHVLLTFDYGMSTQIVIEGYVADVVNTEDFSPGWVLVSGKEKFIKDSESKIFINLGTEPRRYRDLKNVAFIAETLRETTT